MAAKKRRKPARRDRAPGPAASAPAPAPTKRRPGTALPAGPWFIHVVVCVLLMAATYGLYRGDLDLGFFNLDDPGYVTANPHLEPTAANLKFILTQPYFANYSPVHLLSYVLDRAVGGMNPRTFHLSSNLWAGLVACGVYLLGLVLFAGGFRRDGGGGSAGRRVPVWPFAMASALLFTVHPAHVEAVAWISSRKDLVAAAFTLPAMAAYFAYRRSGSRGRVWYGASIVLFVLGVLGKLSVVVVPGILFLFDLFLERRRLRDAVIDKIPYMAVAALVSLRVMGAQPATRKDFDLFVLGASSLQSLWLLGGFGEYVLSRLRPSPAEVAGLVALFLRLVPFLLLVVPFLLRKRLPGIVTGLLYFLILSLLPPQILNFINPVADRYLFFPSVAVVLLLGWLGMRSLRWGKMGIAGSGAIAVILLGGWTAGTLGYLAEWRDPRSVWFAAAQKSEDPTVFQNLGSYYQDEADALPDNVRGRTEGGKAHVARLAAVIWRDDQRLEPLLQEMQRPGISVPVAKAFQDELKARALTAYQEAIRRKGNRVMPNLLFRVAKLQLDAGQTDQALASFERAYEESQRHTFPAIRAEYAVRTRYAMGVAHWQKGELKAALPLIQEAETAQKASGGNWVPNIDRQRERLISLIGRADSTAAGATTGSPSPPAGQ